MFPSFQPRSTFFYYFHFFYFARARYTRLHCLFFNLCQREKRREELAFIDFLFFCFVCVRASSVVFAAEIEPLKSMSFFLFVGWVNYFFQFRRLLFTASLDGSVGYYVRGEEKKEREKNKH